MSATGGRSGSGNGLRAGNSGEILAFRPPPPASRTAQEVQALVDALVWQRGGNLLSHPDLDQVLAEVGLGRGDVSAAMVERADCRVRDRLIRNGPPPAPARPATNRPVFIISLEPGDCFQMPNGLTTGVLLAKNDCEAAVRIFRNGSGNPEEKRWSPQTEVIPLKKSEFSKPEAYITVEPNGNSSTHEGSQTMSATAPLTLPVTTARQLFAALGKSAESWTPKRLEVKLNALPQLLGDCEEPKGKADLVLLRRVTGALAEGRKVVVGDAPAAAEPAKAKGGKAKPESNGHATSAKAKGGKGGTPAKGDKAKPEVRRAPKNPKDVPPSNKGTVYKVWAKAKDKSPAKAEEYHKLVKEQVRLQTIKSWISDWNRGTNLPAIAKAKAS